MDSSDDNAMAGVVQNIPQASASIVSNTSPVSGEYIFFSLVNFGLLPLVTVIDIYHSCAWEHQHAILI